MFAVENGGDASPCGQGGIDQRAEVVRVNHVKTLLKNATKAIHGAPLEALSFSERVDGDAMIQFVGVDTCMPQAADFKTKALRIKAVDQVHELVLQASGFQSVDNFQDADSYGGFRHREGASGLVGIDGWSWQQQPFLQGLLDEEVTEDAR